MKKIVFFGLVSILLLPLLMVGCASQQVLTTISAPETQTIDISMDKFTAQNNIVKNIELAYPGSLTVRLGSNPTTGYEWGEAVISNPSVIVQTSFDFVGPENTGIVGAGGTDVLGFDSLKIGMATIKFSYGRPWEGGEKDTFTLTINVTVK